MLLEIFTEMEWKDVRRFRSSTPKDITEGFETMAKYDIERMKSSFSHFQTALAMWTTHPNVNDAILMESSFRGEGFYPNPLLAEIICTRSVGSIRETRCIFQRLYGITLEEKLEDCVPHTLEHQILRVLVTGIERKERSEDEIADYETDLRDVLRFMKNGGPPESALGIAIPKTATKPTKTNQPPKNETDRFDIMISKVFEEVYGTRLSQDVNLKNVKAIFKLRREPVTHFVALLFEAFEKKNAELLTRVVVTRALVDLGEIKEAFAKRNGTSLEHMVATKTTGCYKRLIEKLMAYPGDE